MASRSGGLMHNGIVVVAAVFLFVAAALPVLSEHAQQFDDGTLSFDHRTGNEWWVEVTIDRAVEEVFARPSGTGQWHGLTLRDWGAWAASFHIPAGDTVQFRAGTGDQEVTSCWFTHPDGVEHCEDHEEEKGLEAKFRTPGGNEWWVEVYVDANQPLQGVDARADGGPWHGLTLRDWGAWARSFHVPEGSIVEFRAHAEGDASVMSGGYRWSSGEPVDEAPDDGFVAAFGTKAGNPWWVEAYVISEKRIVQVDARAEDGPWHGLTLRDWGAWAKSFHVPEGSTVTLRAHDEDGGTSVSDAFLWPSGAPADDPDGAWPQEGSYVRYHLSSSNPVSATGGTATLVHHDGDWSASCEWTTTQHDSGQGSKGERFNTIAPAFGPDAADKGDPVDVQVFGFCARSEDFRVDVTGDTAFDTHQNGDPVTVGTWHGERSDPCDCLRWDAEWSKQGGLTVFALQQSTRGHFASVLVDTDAPVDT